MKLLAAGAAGLAGLAGLAAAAAEKPPNFVIMMADDMGWGDWSRTGAPAFTPELDAMSRAEHGVWFERAYAGNPICSPTRASVLTGRTPARTCIYSVEQHILCRAGVGGCGASEYGLGNATRDAPRGDYLSGFYGKWHLGSLSDRGVGSPDCYAKPANGSCVFGYWEKDGGCCFGVDGPKLAVSHPLHFGFDEFVATPECAASATTNCGCFFAPGKTNSTPCETGHYKGGVGGAGYLECMQYYAGNSSGRAARTAEAEVAADRGGGGSGGGGAPSADVLSVEPLAYVTPVDDEAFLVDQFEGLLARAVAAGRPFLAVIFFHGAHIPYVASPATRARYANVTSPATGLPMDENEQDYWGTITQIDGAVGRVRALLRKHGVENDTWVSMTADNGPEVNPAGGQGTRNFANPGLTGGLRGRKRDATEGGTREIGLVEFPRAAVATAGGRVESRFPIATMDLLPSVLDALGLPPHGVAGRALDGTSLLPVLRGEVKERPLAAGIGIHGSFPYGDTNHVVDPVTGNTSTPHRCPNASSSAALGDVPAGFSSAGGPSGSQFSWAEGNDLKLFGCKGYCTHENCNSTSPGFENPGWHFFLYNLTADRAETTDLWAAQRDEARAMFGRFDAWQDSVRRSQSSEEMGCA